MVRKTRGIVLRTVRYGETSLIISVLTEEFGLQSYIINGVRTEKQNKEKASLFTPGSLLDLDVYHHEQRGLNRIREASRTAALHGLAGDVIKSNIALFMMELVSKSLKHPERNEPLFDFCISCLRKLDASDKNMLASFPFYFSLHLPRFLGFSIAAPSGNMLQGNDLFLDMTEGCFLCDHPGHDHFISGEEALLAARLLLTGDPSESENGITAAMPEKFLDFYALHIQDFGKIRSYRMLQELMSE